MRSGLPGRPARLIAAGVTGPPWPRQRRLRIGRVDLVVLADALIAFICWGTTASAIGNLNSRHGLPYGSAVLTLAAFVVSAPVAARSFAPLTAWAGSALAMAWTSWIVLPNMHAKVPFLAAGVIVYLLCLYAVAVRCRTWAVVAVSVVTMLGAGAISRPAIGPAVVLTAAPVFAGVIIRSRRANREQFRVQERRHEGERTLLEERQRIARELHDVVAHHMSVIAIQAEAAPYKTADPPPELVESFAEIRASALSGLSELRRVLGVLRSDRPDTAPQPGLRDLDGLLESARGGGVTVSSRITGHQRELPAGVDLSAYRVVQEALSNAMRHAPGSSVQVELYYGEAALVIEVRNDGCPAPGARASLDEVGRPGPADGSGHGIVGMRERAAMLGGHLQAGPAGDGEFLVTAAFPLGERDLADVP
ncbi:MAG TPA: histidine kinase [Streptosporangiaceae bacterium]